MSPPGAGPRRLAAQAVLENRLQVRRVDGLQLLPVRVAEEGGGEGEANSHSTGGEYNMDLADCDRG